MRILDVGCGTGNPPVRASVQADDVVIGVDINPNSLRSARVRFPEREFLCCRAEALPFSEASFDRVISSVSVPYTEIPVALAEMRRVLNAEGSVFMAVHNLSFTLKELQRAFPRPAPFLYRLYVLANGLVFHVTGRTIRFLNGQHESFQTKRGMTLALSRAGFVEFVFTRPDGRLIVEARVEPGTPATSLGTSTLSTAG